ncbi:MAG TPA: CAP domain-containing protein [Thermodesulfobacteriota bacterium]|nr:CAP domain-containing protein [Thermodesulfobacteriota bacterium]
MKIYLGILLAICLIVVAGCGKLLSPFTGDGRMSSLEDDIVREMNLARTNPRMYASFLEERKRYYDGKLYYRSYDTVVRTREGVSAVNEAVSFLYSVNPLPPLSVSRGMSLAAKDHASDIGPRGAMRHEGRDRSTPGIRLSRYGTWQGEVAENIYYSGENARDIVIGLIVDDGVYSRGHRKNIFNPGFRVVGVGCDRHATYRIVCVTTFAMGYVE